MHRMPQTLRWQAMAAMPPCCQADFSLLPVAFEDLLGFSNDSRDEMVRGNGFKLHQHIYSFLTTYGWRYIYTGFTVSFRVGVD
ncbi:hypothetical protein B0H13DRAFT_1947050 [Mycena leptocephala]|nr:hypothetical protein B0H13DRAFT_1947050 [Mycena leptocephala]